MRVYRNLQQQCPSCVAQHKRRSVSTDDVNDDAEDTCFRWVEIDWNVKRSAAVELDHIRRISDHHSHFAKRANI